MFGRKEVVRQYLHSLRALVSFACIYNGGDALHGKAIKNQTMEKYFETFIHEWDLPVCNPFDPFPLKNCAWINAKIHHSLASIHPCLYNMKKKVSAKNKCQVASWWVRHSYKKLIRKVRHDMGGLEHKLTYTEKACRLLYNILGRRLCKGRAYGAMTWFCAWRDSTQVDVEERSRLWVAWGEHFDFGCLAVASSEVDHLILYVARYNRPQIPLEKMASFTPNFTRSNAGVHGRISRGAHRDKK